MDLTQLSAPFKAGLISWRLGATNGDKTKGIALAYIDARDVMERLDSVCGVDGWQNKHPHANGKTSCAIGIKIGDEWVWKENGAGDSDVEAEKGAFSDSFKRAAVLWGIGRYLYDLGNTWVEIEPAGKSHKIKQGEYAKLEKALNALMIQKFGTESEKKLGGAVGMGMNREQQEQVYSQCLEKISGANDLETLSATWKPYAKTIKTMDEDLRTDLIQKKDELKEEFERKIA